jgi:hypothetical protein
MMHTWYCSRCDGQWSTFCFQERNEEREKAGSLGLCIPCFKTLKFNENPVFELFWKLYEKRNELQTVVSLLDYQLRDTIEPLPGVEEIKHKRFMKEYPFFEKMVKELREPNKP